MIAPAVVVTVAPRAWLAPGAAASYARARADGCPAGITSAGRTRAEQEALYADLLAGRRTASVAVPGTSRHERGTALDLPAHGPREWMTAHGADHGWIKNLVPGEPWHFEYQASRDRHLTDAPPTIAAPAMATQEEDDHMLMLAQQDGDPRVWVGDGITRRHVKDPQEVADIQFKIRTGALKGTPDVQVVSRIAWLGKEI